MAGGLRIALFALLLPPVADAMAEASYLTPRSTIGDLLHHPLLAGFAHLVLPWDNRTYEDSMPLAQIGRLLPYHTHIDPAVVTDSLNRLIADAARGRKMLYHFYPEQERMRRPGLDRTGLFFFRGRPGAPFAVICPGGGFAYVASVHEGFPLADLISKHGYNAFVLKYRTGGADPATRDLAAALGFIFQNAAALEVSVRGYSLWGSSAGARIAAAIGSHGTARYGGTDLPKPAAIVMAYTAHSDYSASEPPTFVVVGEEDRISPPAAMERRVEALRKLGTPVEFRKYKGVGYGFGLGTGTTAEGWALEALRFWEMHMRGPRAEQAR